MPNCHAKTDRIKDYVGKAIAIGSILHQQALSDYIKEDTFASFCGRHSLKPSRSCSVINAKSKDLQMQIMVSCFQAQLHRYSG